VSLRTRLIGALALLATIGLVVAGVLTYTQLRSFLLERVDQSLTGSARVLTFRFTPGGINTLATYAPGTYIQVRSSDGKIIPFQKPDGTTTPWLSLLPPDQRPANPTSPKGLPALVPDEEPFPSRYLTIPSSGSGSDFRARESSLPGGYTLLVAQSLHSVDDTLHRLLLIELAVAGGVLLGVIALAYWLVRLGLRPLDAIETTAAQIAAGDYSQRVERADPQTEVGRLGLSLNEMLGQIERAFDERQASEDRLRQFIADASHELRTPVSAVRAYAELFERGAKMHPDDLDRSMAGIEREARRLSLLVDDLLLLARLDQGRPLERTEVDLVELAGEAVDAARAVEPARPLELRTNGPMVVTGDSLRLRQVIDNLLANVRAHTPPMAAATVSVGADNGDAVVEVSDHGGGLPPETQSRVFERFYRGDASRSRKSGGAGLGLAIVKAIVEAHGGTATAGSEPGAGTTVRVTLPKS
jgi:two-component system OmpR family sensor kinase